MTEASPWTRLALGLTRYHQPLSEGQVADFLAELDALPALQPSDLALPDDEARRLLALDVFMVGAMVRRHELLPEAATASRLEAAVHRVAEALGCQPILSYPFYIRVNPTDLAAIRRFTPLDAEFRFIRMHRLIEDQMDRLIETLDAVLGAAEPDLALAGALAGIADSFRRMNRTVAAFRDPVRMPHEDFYHGFRPYFGPRQDPQTGAVLLQGASGLQSHAFRTLCMWIGYRDEVFDGWTRAIAPYHLAGERAELLAALAGRDAGHCLTALAERHLGRFPALPHLHPTYGRHVPRLLERARRGGYLSPDTLDVLGEHDITLGAWPHGAPELAPLPSVADLVLPGSREGLATLDALAEIEAMLWAFHVEHVAIAAEQIGYERGTGGTSGVEFLLMATFRRAFPWLWLGE